MAGLLKDSLSRKIILDDLLFHRLYVRDPQFKEISKLIDADPAHETPYGRVGPFGCIIEHVVLDEVQDIFDIRVAEFQSFQDIDSNAQVYNCRSLGLDLLC